MSTRHRERIDSSDLLSFPHKNATDAAIDASGGEYKAAKCLTLPRVPLSERNITTSLAPGRHLAFNICSLHGLGRLRMQHTLRTLL